MNTGHLLLLLIWVLGACRNLTPKSKLYDPVKPEAGAHVIDEGTDIGNGGRGVVVGDQVFLFDLWEAGLQERTVFSPIVDPKISDIVQSSPIHDHLKDSSVLVRKISELSRSYPILAFAFASALKRLDWFFPSSRLGLVPDITTPIEDSSQPVQLAVRRGTSVRVSKPYFDSMDSANQTALVLHELVYAFTEEWANAESVREFVQFLLQQDVSSLSESLIATRIPSFLPKYPVNVFPRSVKHDWTKMRLASDTQSVVFGLELRVNTFSDGSGGERQEPVSEFFDETLQREKVDFKQLRELMDADFEYERSARHPVFRNIRVFHAGLELRKASETNRVHLEVATSERSLDPFNTGIVRPWPGSYGWSHCCKTDSPNYMSVGNSLVHFLHSYQ